MDSLISDILCSLLLLECCFLSVVFILNPILLVSFFFFFSELEPWVCVLYLWLREPMQVPHYESCLVRQWKSHLLLCISDQGMDFCIEDFWFLPSFLFLFARVWIVSSPFTMEWIVMLLTVFQLLFLFCLCLSIYEVSNFHEDEHLERPLTEENWVKSRTVIIGMVWFQLAFIHVIRWYNC